MNYHIHFTSAFLAAVLLTTLPARAQQPVVVTPIGAPPTPTPAVAVVPAAQQVTTVTRTVTDAPAATAVTVTTTSAAVPAVGGTAAAPVYGNYYDVAARSISADGVITPQTVRFMLTSDDPATTANTPTAQLILTPAQASAGLLINKSDLPEALQIGPFVDLELLFVPLGPENFRRDFALDMIKADGNFNGHTIQFTSPTGDPLTGFGLIFESTVGSASSPTTGTAITYAGGNILVPNSNLNASTDFPNFSVLIADPTNGQAFRVDSLGVHVVQKQARDADGITQVKAPFLAEPTIASPKLEIYNGQINNAASQPVAYQPFRLDPPYKALLHISQFAPTPSFYTGNDGRFRLAFDTMGYYAERGEARSWSPLTLTVPAPTGPQEFPVAVAQDVVLQMQ